MRTRVACLLFAVALSLDTGSLQAQGPPPAAPREAVIPQPVERTLANGMRVIAARKTGMPLVAARLLVRTGAEADPPDYPGLADMTASLLTKGTRTKSAEEISREVEALGATIESGARWDYSGVYLSALKSNFAEALRYVADAARNPAFGQGELDRLRDQNIDALQVALEEPRTVANFVAMRVIFGPSAYGHNLGGTPESLRRISRADVAAFHRAYFRPDNALLIVAGDIEPATAFEEAERLFADWKKPERPLPTHRVGGSPPASGGRIVVIDMPEAGQAAVIAGRRGIRRAHSGYTSALVSNAVLGGGYSARLNQEIRIKRGLSYGAGSAFDVRRDEGPFTASTQTKNESAAEVAGIILDEINRLTSTSVPESELTPRKASLIGNFARALETTAGLAEEIAHYAAYDLPLSGLHTFIRAVQTVNPDAVREFAEKALAGRDTSVVIVGDASKFVEALKPRFPQIEVIEASGLDLNSPTLRKK
ncbi:MAG TPA: pitrilysin family protein [Thermoanaerobaculia bacterium]|nr:pitrilysin family protein [Thermoanaerobaculia bacterium]